jgi:hypothetical protein
VSLELVPTVVVSGVPPQPEPRRGEGGDGAPAAPAAGSSCALAWSNRQVAWKAHVLHSGRSPDNPLISGAAGRVPTKEDAGRGVATASAHASNVIGHDRPPPPAPLTAVSVSELLSQVRKEKAAC